MVTDFLAGFVPSLALAFVRSVGADRLGVRLTLGVKVVWVASGLRLGARFVFKFDEGEVEGEGMNTVVSMVGLDSDFEDKMFFDDESTSWFAFKEDGEVERAYSGFWSPLGGAPLAMLKIAREIKSFTIVRDGARLGSFLTC